MRTPLTHSEVWDLLAPFALDAVDTDERDAVAAHLATCSSCEREEAGYRHAAASLGYWETPAVDGP